MAKRNLPYTRSPVRSHGVMWTLLRSRSLVLAFISLLVFMLLGIILPDARGGNTNGNLAASAPNPGEPIPIVFQGKFYCLIKRQVVMPFLGTIREVKAGCGKPVKAGEVLATYQLAPEIPAQIRRRLAPPQISDLEIRLAEVEKTIAAMENKRNEVHALMTQNMASSQSFNQVENEIHQLTRQRKALQERLHQESQFRDDDVALLKHQLGVSLDPRRIPTEASLSAPMDGHVILVHPEMKQGAEFPPSSQVFVIGVLEPMVFRAQVHEMEAVQISVGDRSEVVLESVPGKKVDATVSRVSWTPSTPGLDQPTYYEVELTVSNPNLQLKEGLKGQATIRKTSQ